MVLTALTLWVSAPYYALQQLRWVPARPMRLTWLDQLIPFDDRAVWVYLSLYLLLPLALWLMRGEDLWPATRGLALIALVSHLCFLFWPTYVPLPRPATAQTNFLYGWMTAVDQPLNACPSLHASLAVFAGLWCQRLVRAKRWAVGIWFWVAAILLATLATRQHVVWDLVAGALLGVAVFFAGELMKQTEARAVIEPESLALQATLHVRAELSRGLETPLQELRRFVWWKRLCELTLFPALLLCGVWLTTAGRHSPVGAGRFLLLGSGIVISALAINSLVLLMHEGMHNTLFAGRGWNRWVSVALGATFLMSFSAYQVMHIRHHDYLGDPRDPDDYHNYAHNRRLVWALHFVRLTVGPLLYIFLIPGLAFKHGSPSQRRRVVVEYAVLLTVYATVLLIAPLDWLIYCWLLPLLLVGQMTAIRGFTQHGITDASDPYLASRSIQANRLTAFFLLNENHHLEHHLFPEVPSYHLRRLHELLWPRLPYAVAGTSYLGFLVRFFRATPRLDETPIGLTAISRTTPVEKHG